MASFSERILMLRKQAELTQEELGNLMGVHKQTISQYERGVRRPAFETLERLCDYFNVSSDYMLGNSDVTLKFLGSDELAALSSSSRKIPVLGMIAAGVPKEAISETEEYIEIPSGWVGDFGALRVQGDSMSPEIKEGDILIFHRQEDARSGEIVVAMIDDTDTTVKKIVKSRNGVTLLPENPEYEPLKFDKNSRGRLKLLGKVVEIRRRFLKQ